MGYSLSIEKVVLLHLPSRMFLLGEELLFTFICAPVPA